MNRDDKRGEVSFTNEDNPSSDYKRRIQAAKDAGHTPIGGVPMPKVPPLDSVPSKDRHGGVQRRSSPGNPVSPDVLNQAVAAGQAIPGVGAAYPANQPRGSFSPQPQQAPTQTVITSQDGNPVNPPRQDRALRPETVEQVQAVVEANKDETVGIPAEDEEYFTALGSQTKDIFRNKERRKAIEAKIEDELNFEDLLYQQELRQRVPIRRNFVPQYRTPSGAEDLFVKRLLGKEEGSPTYIMDRFALMSLCCGLFAINGKPLPDHLDENKNPKEELFNKKIEVLLKYPLILLADISANFQWFEERVQKLLSLEQVKNF
jgi:hypothetical protein